MTIGHQKRAMRAAVKRRILAMEPNERARQEDEIRRLFGQLPGYEGAVTVLLYASRFPEEFSTWPLMDLVIRSGRRLVCPRVDREARRLDLFAVRDPSLDFERAENGLPEPLVGLIRVRADEIDWALVPGLAFDGKRFRLGRGGGYYDRLIPTLRQDCPRWSLAFDEQWVQEVPIEPHDQPLTGVIGCNRGFPGRSPHGEAPAPGPIR